MDAASSPRVVYVAGYGRSGSTLLDVILGNHPQAFGAGELTWIFRHFLEGQPCSCGQPLHQCGFWTDVIGRTLAGCPGLDVSGAADLTLKNESLISSRRDEAAFAELWRRMFEQIAAVSGRPIVIDSSKTSRLSHRRPALFRRGLGLPFRMVHLVRDPRGVMWSAQRGSNRRLESGDSRKLFGGMTRGLLSWTFSNVSVESLVKRLPRPEVHRLRYEDLVQHPAEQLAALGEFLEIDLAGVHRQIQEAAPFDPGHGVAGNRMRRNTTITLRLDEEWKQKLPGYAKAIALIARPLMKKYGYV